jgi:hypothetical protein
MLVYDQVRGYVVSTACWTRGVVVGNGVLWLVTTPLEAGAGTSSSSSRKSLTKVSVSAKSTLLAVERSAQLPILGLKFPFYEGASALLSWLSTTREGGVCMLSAVGLHGMNSSRDDVLIQSGVPWQSPREVQHADQAGHAEE